MTDPKILTDRFWALFEAGRIDELGAMLDGDCHFKMPGLELRSRDALLEVLRGYRTAFPDLRHEVISHVASADTIALELVVTGTHTGPMHTPAGVVAATGKAIRWDSCDFLRVRDGRFVSWHVYHDPMPFLGALGLLTAP